MGWLWQRLGRTDWLRPPARPSDEGLGKGAAFWGSVRHDVMHAGGFLVVGAMAAATLKAVVPASWLSLAADNPVVAVLALAVLAVLLSICSEADAFVAASLTQFSLTARLAFLVVGPMIDLKLFAMQTATFGRGFAAPLRAGHLRHGRGVGGPRRGGAAVNRQAQAVVLFLVGGAMVHAGITDLYLRYVKAGLQPIRSSARASCSWWPRWRRSGTKRKHSKPGSDKEVHVHDQEGARHDRGGHVHREPRVSWLLVLPCSR